MEAGHYNQPGEQNIIEISWAICEGLLQFNRSIFTPARRLRLRMDPPPTQM